MFRKFCKILFWLILILAIIYLVEAYRTSPAQDHPFFNPHEHQVDVIAHRGGRGLWPGNTLYGFKQAVDLGVDILEMDVRSTKDGALVILHDNTVDRTTDGKGPVRNFTLKELKYLDAGFTWTNDDGKSYPYRSKGITIPSLSEVFDELPNARLNIEIKQSEPDITTQFGNLIRQHNMTNRVMVASFDNATLRRFRSQFPEIATSAGFTEGLIFYVLSRFHLSAAYRPNAHALQVPRRFGPLNTSHPSFLSAAKKHNLKFHYWTVDEPQMMQTFIDLGADGIITVYPDRLIKLLDH
jgi:glycerophosphoryl diester phosphodiesterase